MIARAVQEYLGLVFQSSEGSRMNNARPVTLEFRSEGVARLGVFPAARVTRFLSERRQDTGFVRLHLFPPLPALRRIRAGWQIVRHGKDYSWVEVLCQSGNGAFYLAIPDRLFILSAP